MRPTCFAAAVAALISLPAYAQPTRSTLVDYAITGLLQGNADLDRGGQFDVGAVDVRLGVSTMISPTFRLGVTGSVGLEDYSFDAPVAFGGRAPWGRIERATLGVPMTWLLDDGWRVSLTPQMEYAAEDDAKASESYGYGALAVVSRTFSKDLTLGFGLGAYRRFDDNSFYPVILVNWRIDERWTLSNPLPAGPAGPAGLEISYQLDPSWQIGFGGAYRSFRFRLNEAGPTPNGIGEYRSVPLFARLGWQLMPAARLDFYAGVGLNGQLKLQSPGATTLVSEDFDPAPFAAVGLVGRF